MELVVNVEDMQGTNIAVPSPLRFHAIHHEVEEVVRVEDVGPMRVSVGTVECRKKPSMTPSFCKLRLNLSRQRNCSGIASSLQRRVLKTVLRISNGIGHLPDICLWRSTEEPRGFAIELRSVLVEHNGACTLAVMFWSSICPASCNISCSIFANTGFRGNFVYFLPLRSLRWFNTPIA